MITSKIQPLVSIVTPSRNQAPFLEATIQSVLSQDYPEIEYLVIDGASNDDSLEIIHKYRKQLTYWVSEPDHGQTDAINKGFARARGEILAWLNSDDIYLPRTITRAVDIPVIASGGAGTAAHVVAAFTDGEASAALVAGILHDGATTVRSLKQAMLDAGIPTRRTW